MRILQYLLIENTPPVRLISSFISLGFMAIWGVLRKWKKTHDKAPGLIVFLYSLVWCMITNFSFRNQMPPLMHEPDPKSDEDTILTTLFICHCINYNSFLTTVLLQPAIILTSYYC